MQLCGDSLHYLRKKCPHKTFTLNMTVQVAMQCLDSIEHMHKCDLLHRDIKPENFLTGATSRDRHIVFLVDFGLVRQYRNKGLIRPERRVAAFRGTVAYASVNILLNRDASRSDDLISWLYVIIECLKGSLPWDTVSLHRRKLATYKKDAFKELLDLTPPELTVIYHTLHTLKYTDEPPYGLFRIFLKQIMERAKIKDTDPFDFEPGGAHYDAVFSKLQHKRADLKRKRERQRNSKDDMTMKHAYQFGAPPAT